MTDTATTHATADKGVAIITGAAQGIGKGIALRLASDGFDIAICDIEPKRSALEEVAQEIRSQGRKAATFITDVSNEDQVKELVEKTVEALGPLTAVRINI